jgi:hypothetical protein
LREFCLGNIFDFFNRIGPERTSDPKLRSESWKRSFLTKQNNISIAPRKRLEVALSWRRVTPFIIGETFGVPLGAVLLTFVNPAYVRFGVGSLLVIYSMYDGMPLKGNAENRRAIQRGRAENTNNRK